MSFIVAAVIGGAAAVGGAVIAGNSAENAADTQAEALANAQAISAAAAAEARASVLGLSKEAYDTFIANMGKSIEQIANGTITASDILKNSTTQSNNVLTNAGANAAAQLLGYNRTAGKAYDEQTYVTNRANAINKQAQAGDPEALKLFQKLGIQAGGSITPGQAKQVLIDAGFTPEDHFNQFAAKEGISGSTQDQLTPSNAGLEPALQTLQNVPQLTGDNAQKILKDGTASAVSRLDPYAQVGNTALQKQAAMSGALGSEEQQKAIDSFIESPGQKFLRERQEQSLLRNSAAVGGLGGGGVRTALQEQAYGIAAQQQQEQFTNLGTLSNLGSAAAGTQGGFEQSSAATGAGIDATVEQARADLQMRATLAAAQLKSDTGTNLSNIAMGTGNAVASNISNLGTNQANLTGTGAANTANLYQAQGQGASNILNAQGTTLANLATQSGTQQANLATQIGETKAAGLLGQGAAFQNGLSGLSNIAGQYYQNQQNQALIDRIYPKVQ